MTPERRAEISAKGGASVKAENRSFSKNRDLAASAGRTGGSSAVGSGRPRKVSDE